MTIHSCVAYPCEEDRLAGSAFCPDHKEAHDNSEWVKAWNKYQADISKMGLKKAVFKLPKKKEE